MYAGSRRGDGVFAVWERRRRHDCKGPHVAAVLLLSLRAFLVLRIAVSVETLLEQRA
jgi:hypothetical protein